MPKRDGSPTVAERRKAERAAATEARIAGVRAKLGDQYVSPFRAARGAIARLDEAEHGLRCLDVYVPDWPPTPNDRASYWQRNRDRATWREIGRRAGRKAIEARGLPWAPLERARVTVTFVHPTRAAHDYVNAVASLKPVEDGIVEAGVLVDDSNRHVAAFEVRFEHVPGERAIIYSVREV